MKSALLVIDVQKGLFEPTPFDADQVISRINGLAARARKSGAPVIFIQHETAPGSALGHGSSGWDLLGSVQVEPDDHFTRKTTPDSFLKTRLEELLKKLQVTHLVVSGYATEFCVDTTTRRAAALGYQVTLAADAHTTHDKPHANGETIRAHHNATLPAMASFGVTIKALSSEDIAFG